MQGLPGAAEGMERFKNDMEALEKKDSEKKEEPKKEEIKDPENIESVVADLLGEKDKEEPKEEEPKVEEKEEPKTDDVVEKKKEEEKDPEPEPASITSPIFGGKQPVEGEKEIKTEAPKFDGLDDANKFIKEKTGLDSLESLIDSSLTSKQQLSEFDEIKSARDNYDRIFENLPTELYQGVKAHLNGEDWKTPIFSKPNLDFNKSLENQGDKALVESYHPGKVTQEDWEDYHSDEPDPGLKKGIDFAIENSRTRFQADKQELESFKGEQIKQADAQIALVNKSIERSISHLKKNIEGVDDSYISQTKNNMTIQKVSELFFEPDGTFKEGAALAMSMAEHGYDMLEQYKVIATHQAESKERQTVLDRTPEKPKAKGKSEGKKDNIRSDVKKRLEATISGMLPAPVY